VVLEAFVVVGASGVVVVGAGVVDGVERGVGGGGATTEVVGDGVTPRRGAGGTMAGLLGALTSLPTAAVSSQRRGFRGARRIAVSKRPSSFFVVEG
jgi:hypothetical protein